jgi:hypothetical protein
VLSGRVTHHKGMAGWRSPCPAAFYVSFNILSSFSKNASVFFWGKRRIFTSGNASPQLYVAC